MKIHVILKMTELEYELLLMGWWLSYCKSKTSIEAQTQKLMINNPLFNWWRSNLSLAEKEFKQDALPFHKMYTQEDATKLYAKHAWKLQIYHSSPLIKEALNKL